MERRGWPWKKKITERLASAALEFKQSNEQLDSRLDLKDRPDVTTPLQQAEARLKILTEQLSAKDDVVQQHAKVAEEAVSGWEKAESDAASMKKQLDAETQKRIATEDRVSHLDGALKECMRQLRLVREQQEQTIHEMLVRKTREWDIVREEMETQMAKMENELLESEAEKTAMAKSLQERAMLIKEAKDGKGRAEEEIKLLQVRVEISEREQAKWKYELHVLSKELEIRNEELQYNKKASEIANKQHLENVKKVAKLEAENQRLRFLVRKKLPGPAAVAQMRIEVEALGTLPSSPVDRGRRMSPSRRNQTAGWKQDRGLDPPWAMGNEGGTSDRLSAMDEENRVLKEALSKSNDELQAARLQFTQTARKLSSVEEHLEISNGSSHSLPMSHCPGRDGTLHVQSCEEPSIASVSEDGVTHNDISCAESWATALMSELAQFGKKERGSSASETMMDSSSCDFMDDFAEMEKLASLPSGKPPKSEEQELCTYADASRDNVNKDHHEKGKDFQALDGLKDLSNKRNRTDEDLNIVKLRKLAAKAALLSAEKNLSSIFEHGEGANLKNILNELCTALSDVRGPVANGALESSVPPPDKPFVEIETAEVRDTRVWSPSGLSSCQSEDNLVRQEIILPAENVKDAASELANMMHKVVCLVEALTQVDYYAMNSETDTLDAHMHVDSLKLWRSSQFDSCVQSLVALCHSVLTDKVDILDFVAEMTSAFEWLVFHIFSLPSKLIEANYSRRRLDWAKGPVNAFSSLSLSSTNNGPREALDHCTNGESARLLEHEEVLRSLEIHVDKVLRLEDELGKLKVEKETAHERMKSVSAELDHLRSQLQESTRKGMEVQCDLASSLESKQSMIADLAHLSADKSSLESLLCNSKDDIRRLKERIELLEVQLQDETQCRKDIEVMFNELHEKHSQPVREKGQPIMKHDQEEASDLHAGDATKKDQEIAAAAEKLAECQQTILELGKQLKDLGAAGTGKQQEEAGARFPGKHGNGEQRMHSLSDQLPSASNGESPRAAGLGERRQLLLESPAEELATGAWGSQRRGPRHGGAQSYGQLSSLGDTYRAADLLLLSPESCASSRKAPTASAARDLALTSPGRSPARFLGFKGRSSSSSSDPKPEHASSGLTRFFSRTKISRQ